MDFDVQASELWQALLDLKRANYPVHTISPNLNPTREFFHVHCADEEIPEEEAMLYSTSISGLNYLLVAMKREGYKDPQIVAQEKAKDFFILTYCKK